MAKKIFALILAGALLVFMVACGDDIPVVDEFEINVSGGGFFGNSTDATDTSDTVGDTASDTEDTAASSGEISDTEGA